MLNGLIEEAPRHVHYGQPHQARSVPWNLAVGSAFAPQNENDGRALMSKIFKSLEKRAWDAIVTRISLSLRPLQRYAAKPED